MLHHTKKPNVLCFLKKQQSNGSYINHFHKTKFLKNIALIAVFLLLLIAHAAFIQANIVYAQADSISHSVLRLRVVANSDSEQDQELKLAFKSRLCEILEPYLSDCSDACTAIDWIQNNLPFIQEQADSILSELTETYRPTTCTVSLTNSNFPTRVYGNLTFPPGNYRTLLITLGNGKGHNWWCVLYPSLCFTNESTASFPEEAQTKLQQTLSKEDYETINQGVTYRFRIAEIVGSLYEAITSAK